jgi:glycosyltransferase involved in cell wall biosynthesis
LNNVGAAASDGDLLLFLNDDIEVIDGEWLSELVAQASRPNVGAAGAMLLYPDGRIQHGGIWLVDHGGGARHHLHFLKPDEKIYQNLQHVVREVSGNTGACLMMRREVFDELGGFDEELAVVGNDLDMCLRLRMAGYRNLWTPFSRLIHYESISRKNTSISADEGRMWKRWEKAFMAGDPFYNPNLTQLRTDCSLKEQTPPEKSVAPKEGNGEGVNLIGYIRAEMGIGEATRGCACAMESAQIDFGIINYEYGNPSRMNDGSWDSHIVDELGYDINILHINADLTPDAVKYLPKDYFDGRYNIGFWTWELPEFPDEWVSSFGCVDEVWVPSSFVHDAVFSKSTVPVVRVPYSIKKPAIPYLTREFFQLPGHGFLFLMMYDIHSIEERKNPRGAIQAFRQAFSSTDQDVGLVIKVNNASAEELAILRRELVGHKSVHIIDTVMDRYEVDSLISCCDCFVSLHRSEGFGLVIAEAMALGRPVIATNWSGNTDFMKTGNAACVDFELHQLGRDYGPYKAHQYWAEPNIEHAAWWMQKLAADPATAQQMGARAKQTVERQLAPEQVGNFIRSRLQEIRKGLKPVR